jgi:riboflavin synthase
MFTGIIEHLGMVASVTSKDLGRALALDVGPLNGIGVGDSLAVNGVCLTAAEVEDGLVLVEVIGETLSRSNLGELVPGDVVNLERAMAIDGRFDGHVVQGHVDGVGKVLSISDPGDGVRLEMEVPGDLVRYVVEKGSITVDGISLTVAGLNGEVVDIALIPHTMAMTTLGLRKPGDTVNLEVDVLAKYVERLLESR